MLNRNSLSGAFALSLNYVLNQAVQNRDLKTFKTILDMLPTDLDHVSAESRSHFKTQLHLDMLKLNAQIDAAFGLIMTTGHAPRRILDSEVPQICESSCDTNLYKSESQTGVPIWVAEYHDMGTITITCYKLPNLLIATILTPERFVDSRQLQHQYAHEFEVVSAFLDDSERSESLTSHSILSVM